MKKPEATSKSPEIGKRAPTINLDLVETSGTKIRKWLSINAVDAILTR